jgi:hypothetical protein
MSAIPLDGAPLYVKLVIWLLMWFGLPVVLVIAFFFVFIGYLPSPLLETNESMREHRREMTELLKFVAGQDRVMRQICRNTSTDPADRVGCGL